MFSKLLFCMISALVATVYGQVVEHHGNMRYYLPNVGPGACGFTSQNNEYVVSVPAPVFDNYPGATGNPNNNPICNQRVTITGFGMSGFVNITARVVDRSGDTNPDDIMVSPAIFNRFANPDEQSIMENIDWSVMGERAQ